MPRSSLSSRPNPAEPSPHFLRMGRMERLSSANAMISETTQGDLVPAPVGIGGAGGCRTGHGRNRAARYGRDSIRGRFPSRFHTIMTEAEKRSRVLLLSQAVSDPDPGVCWNAARDLAGFGRDAAAALPAL